jgi:hypothetical protein
MRLDHANLIARFGKQAINVDCSSVARLSGKFRLRPGYA